MTCSSSRRLAGRKRIFSTHKDKVRLRADKLCSSGPCLSSTQAPLEWFVFQLHRQLLVHLPKPSVAASSCDFPANMFEKIVNFGH